MYLRVFIIFATCATCQGVYLDDTNETNARRPCALFCLINPCTVEPCDKDQTCINDCCKAKCVPGPKTLPKCYKSRISYGRFCTQVLTTFCDESCKRCCINNNGCTPNYFFRKRKSECDENH